MDPSTSGSTLTSTTTSRLCGFCGRERGPEGAPLLKCGGCEQAWYCDVEHQKYNWKRHKPQCKTAQAKRALESNSLVIVDPPSEPVPVPKSIQPADTSDHSVGSGLSERAHSMSSGYGSLLGSSTNLSAFSPVMRKTSLRSEPPSHRRTDQAGVMVPNRPLRDDQQSHAYSAPSFFLSEQQAGGGKQLKFRDHSSNWPYSKPLDAHLRETVAGDTAGATLNQHHVIALRVQYIAEHVLNSLNEFGWALVDHFLGNAHCMAVRRELEQMYAKNMFTPGQLMETREGSSTKSIRSDEIFWYDGQDERAAEAVTVRLVISMVDSVIVQTAGKILPYQISGRSRAMLACYPPNGARYVKHVDNPIEDGRCVTSLYYVNPNWIPEHGGSLRLFPHNSATPIDIEPKFDRLVFFWSDRRMPHEVLPSYHLRFAVTIWYFDAAEKSRAMERAKNGGRKTSQQQLQPSQGNNNNNTETSGNDLLSVQQEEGKQQPQTSQPVIVAAPQRWT